MRSSASRASGDFAALYRSKNLRRACALSGAPHKAHARRKYYDVYVADRSPTAAEALERIGELYAIELEIRGCSPSERQAVRQARSASVLEDLLAWLSATQRTLSAKSPLAGAIHYTLVRWVALTRYVDDGRVEVDNNAAERAIRALVLGRHNYLFAGSDAGGEALAFNMLIILHFIEIKRFHRSLKIGILMKIIREIAIFSEC